MNTAAHKPQELRQLALFWLTAQTPIEKVAGVLALQQDWLGGIYILDTQATFPEPDHLPGRPEKPVLVPPIMVQKRSMRTTEGRAALIHALAHIEFNAINLALDAIWRFSEMPETYYADWLKVAAEEAYHFTLLQNHLQTLGYHYGDFTGHNSLWEMVEKTKGDVLARMALVPRTMEARGLDASPPLRNKFAQVGDTKATEILDIILRDEIGHVAIGNTWFNWLCTQHKLDPIATFEALCAQYKAPKLRPPFNFEARKQAGFSDEENKKLLF
jgi:uncharacterized ferritin-like protein (DUF455 family)